MNKLERLSREYLRSIWMLSLAVLCTASASLTAQSGPADRTGDEEEKTRILFVFDASNSMNAYWGHNRKWDVATALLSAP